MKDQLEALIQQMYHGGILYSEAVREFKKRFILTVLQENNGNQCRAARELGMLSSFMVAGTAYDAEQLAKCNAKAKKA